MPRQSRQPIGAAGAPAQVVSSPDWNMALWAVRLVSITWPAPVRSRAFSAAITPNAAIEAEAKSLTAMTWNTGSPFAALRGLHAAARLQQRIEARPPGLRAARAVGGDRAGDDARVGGQHVRVADAQPVAYAQPVVVQHHVGLAHQVEEKLAAGRLLQVDH